MSTNCRKQLMIGGRRCSECELFFQPKTTAQLFCSNCIMGQPLGKKQGLTAVDHIYMNNLQNTVTSDHKDRPKSHDSLPIMPNVSPMKTKHPQTETIQNEATSNKKPRLHNTLVMLLPTAPTAIQRNIAVASTSSQSQITYMKNNFTALKRTEKSGSLPGESMQPVVDLSSDEEASSNEERPSTSGGLAVNIKQERNESHVIFPRKSNLSEKRCKKAKTSNIDSDINRNTCGTKTALNEPFTDDGADICSGQDKCRNKYPLVPSLKNNSDVPNEPKDSLNELASQNSQLILWNQRSGYMSLEKLQEKEAELNVMLRSFTSESDIDAVAASDTHQQRISELKSQRAAYQEAITRKEAIIEDLESEINRLVTVVNAFKKERDSLDIHMKSSEGAVKHARMMAKNLEEQLSEVKRNLAATKDPDVVKLLTISLKNNEKRALDSRTEVTRSIVTHKEAQEDFQQVEEDLKEKEAGHEKLLVQLEKEKSELSSLYRKQAINERDTQFHDSQLDILQKGNKEKIIKMFELEEQLLDINYQKKKIALNAKKKSIRRMLAID